jgi:hypothetical protein
VERFVITLLPEDQAEGAAEKRRQLRPSDMTRVIEAIRVVREARKDLREDRRIGLDLLECGDATAVRAPR